MKHPLWSALNELDPALIDSARPNQLNKKTTPALARPVRLARLRHILMSASLGVILILVLFSGLVPNFSGIVTPSTEPGTKTSPEPELPLLMIDIKAGSYDEIMQYGPIEKLHEMGPNFLEGLTTFPMYSGMNVPERWGNNAQMRIWGMPIVEELDLELIEVIEQKEVPDRVTESITFRCREANLTVSDFSLYSYRFHEPIALPYVNDWMATGLTPQQATEVLDEILVQFNQLFNKMGLTRPVAVAVPTISGYYFYFYQDSDNAGIREINRQFNIIRVDLDKNGRLYRFIRTNKAPRSDQFIGNYPIVNIERARELLYEGRYYTYWYDKDYKVDEQSEIVGWEALLLPCGSREWTKLQLMPFYRFYVRIDVQTSDYNISYAVPFDVPAIELSYLATIPDRTIYVCYEE